VYVVKRMNLYPVAYCSLNWLTPMKREYIQIACKARERNLVVLVERIEVVILCAKAAVDLFCRHVNCKVERCIFALPLDFTVVRLAVIFGLYSKGEMEAYSTCWTLFERGKCCLCDS